MNRRGALGDTVCHHERSLSIPSNQIALRDGKTLWPHFWLKSLETDSELELKQKTLQRRMTDGTISLTTTDLS